MALHQLTFQSVLESEDSMLDSLAEILVPLGLDSRLQYAVMLAISEAFTNALQHGNHFDPRGKIIIRLDINEERILADIMDEGTGGLGKISRHRNEDLLSDHGRGIELIKHYAAGVTFAETESGGLQASIRFERE
ncbi:MAG: ATP-binding protein [Candidatus Zixiibacteriota bacterium]